MTKSDVEVGAFILKVIGEKKRWRAYKARTRQLPGNYRTATEAVERYLMYFVPTDSDSAISMFEDLADLFDRAAADGTPIRDIVGADPAEFVESFVHNYSGGGYVPASGRKRLIDAIDSVADSEPQGS